VPCSAVYLGGLLIVGTGSAYDKKSFFSFIRKVNKLKRADKDLIHHGHFTTEIRPPGGPDFVGVFNGTGPRGVARICRQISPVGMSKGKRWMAPSALFTWRAFHENSIDRTRRRATMLLFLFAVAAPSSQSSSPIVASGPVTVLLNSDHSLIVSFGQKRTATALPPAVFANGRLNRLGDGLTCLIDSSQGGEDAFGVYSALSINCTCAGHQHPFRSNRLNSRSNNVPLLPPSIDLTGFDDTIEQGLRLRLYNSLFGPTRVNLKAMVSSCLMCLSPAVDLGYACAPWYPTVFASFFE
jgi:hypothetical protein